MVKCHKCGTMHPDGMKFCNKCGSSLELKLKYYCSKCGAEVTNKDAKFCLECGQEFDDENKLIEDYEDYSKYVCNHCGALLKNKRAKFCNNCRNEFDETNKPLKWDENNPLYRLCTYCGQEYSLLNYPVKCEKCGHDLDFKPRREPKLTKEEQKIVDDRIAEENRIAEEKQKAEEAAEEEKRQKILKRKAKIRKAIKITACSVVVTAVLTATGILVWKSFDDNNIAKAEAALAVGDYKSAIKYYNYVMPLSDVRKECDEKAKKVQTAGNAYERALNDYNKYSYLSALKSLDQAKIICPKFEAPNDLYNKCMDSLGKYLKTKYDAKEYLEVYRVITELNKGYLSESIKAMWTSVRNMIDNNNAEAQKNYDMGNITQAINYADAALAISPTDSQATTIKYKANAFIGYENNIIKASNAYQKGDYYNAQEYFDEVPDNEIGNKAKAKYPTFVKNFTEDLQYKDNPVSISNKSCHSTYTSWHDSDYADFGFTLQNMLNRPVEVQIEFERNSDTRYEKYYLAPKQKTSYTYTMYNIYVSSISSGTYTITVNDFDIN